MKVALSPPSFRSCSSKAAVRTKARRTYWPSGRWRRRSAWSGMWSAAS